jgi:gamma-glutamylcyclotransferase (GGCT)/AIG2-like uncharacterized protein YtfP
VKVFVYGSLLSGQIGHRRLRGSPMIGPGRTEPLYTLVDLGPYPALLEGGSTSVQGEVYEVDDTTLALLDEFEGHPHLYRRTIVRLTTPEQASRRAFAYVLERSSLAEGREIIVSGDWKHRRQ